MKIIDLSSFNKISDYTLPGFDGFIHRFITKSGKIDNAFVNNFKNITKILVGVYIYSYINKNNFQFYAEKIIVAYKKYGLKCKIIFDVETKTAWNNFIYVKKCAELVEKETGAEICLYTNYSMYKTYKSKIPADWKVWLARYYLSYMVLNENFKVDETKKPVTIHILIGWQYTSSMNSKSVQGKHDCSLWYEPIEETKKCCKCCKS